MPTSDQIVLELFKAAFSAVTLTVGAFLTTIFWSGWQKRRELQLAAADAFHKLYGEFFAVWKLWNAVQKQKIDPNPGTAAQWELFDRAAKAEAGVEGVFVRLVCERPLTDEEIDTLARFRQGYQMLRESIVDNTPLPWSHSEHPEYLSFKSLACSVASLLSSRLSSQPPTGLAAGDALRQITSNYREDNWVLDRFKAGWNQTEQGWVRT